MLSLHLESRVDVDTPLDRFPSYLKDPRSLPMWDRSVARVEITSTGPLSAGSTFNTIGYARGKKKGQISAYCIVHIERTFNQVELTNSRLFQKALWGVVFTPTTHGTEITCTIDLVTKRRYFFMVPMLRANKRAIRTDLGLLKEIIENDQGPQEFEQSTT
jgi:hypothetical protein